MNCANYYLSPSIFDNLTTDITGKTLKNEISEKLGHQYLSQLNQQQKEINGKRMGIFFGASARMFISIPTRFKDRKPIWIHYNIITTSPFTFLTSQAIRALTGPNIEPLDGPVFCINGQPIAVKPSPKNYDCNIIGIDYLKKCGKLSFTCSDQEGIENPNFSFEFEKHN